MHQAATPLTTIRANVFKHSAGPFIDLLNEYDVQYHLGEVRAGVVMAGPGALEIVQAVGVASAWGGLAAVLVAFLKARSGRKVIITTKDGTIIHAEGLTASEFEDVLNRTAYISVVDMNRSAEASVDNASGA